MTTRRKIPHSRIPLVDKDGLITREWYDFLSQNAVVGAPATSANAGVATALPATPEAYVTITVNGVQLLSPVYNP